MATASQLGAGTIDSHKHNKYDGSGHQVNCSILLIKCDFDITYIVISCIGTFIFIS